MLQYVDGFSCSLNQETGSLALRFTQKEPIVPDEGDITLIEHDVASLVMTKETAGALYQFLSDFYSGKSDNE